MSKDQLITEALRAWIGRETPLRRLESVTASDIRRYVDATEDANPLWLDDEFARSKGYRRRLLPPIMVAWGLGVGALLGALFGTIQAGIDAGNFYLQEQQSLNQGEAEGTLEKNDIKDSR